MTSQSDEENEVHPLVSNLLGQKFIPRTGQVLRYDREEMIRLSTTPLSMQRPDNLSVDFDGDDGKFSPFKWLEYRWEVEGIKNRAPAKKLQDALSTGAMDENAGLSPQRRGFSGGCRAPTDEKGKDGLPSSSGFGSEGVWTGVERERDRMSSTNSKNWRGGSNGTAEKYSGKSNDFKLPFQKSTSSNVRGSSLNSTGSWRSEMKDRGLSLGSGKYSQSRNQRDERDRGERIPEWADGSTTMDDMIELRGFEEPIKKSKRGAGSRAKDEKDKEREKDKKGDGKKESLENGKSDQHRTSENPEGAVSRPLGSVLPETDVELAAILGLLDVQDEGVAASFVDKVGIVADDSSSTATTSGSRLSRFFKNNNQSDSSAQIVRSVSEDSHSSNPLLAKIFAQAPSSGSPTPQNVQGTPSMLPLVTGPGGVRGMRLEDLEKAFSSKDARNESMTKDNSLQDSNQQAHFLSRLQNFVKQQEESHHHSTGAPNPTPGLAPSVGGVFPPGASPFLPPVLPPGTPIVPPAILARMAAENPAIMQAHIQAQLHQAIAAQLAASGGVGVPPVHMHEQVRAALMRLQQQQLVAAAAAQGKMGKIRPPTQMIPSSVQRQMNKASSSQQDEIGNRNIRNEQDGSPTHISETDALEAVARNNADMLKKMHMQHQYAAMMNAMQGGLPMAAWRPPPHSANNGVPPNPQAQAQLLMQMAQVQQLAQVQQRLRLKQQQQAAFAKIMQLQGHQQAAASVNSMQVPNLAERNTHNFGSSSSFGTGSDLSGPIQSPLEKLLAAAGVQPAQFTGTNHETTPSFQNVPQSVAHVGNRMPPPSVRPMSLEELERKLTEQTK